MILKKLKLTNFRNYLDFEEGFHHLKTIIIGQNAQGKSNILEAINILATSQSDRAEKDSNLVYWNKEYALIFANIETKDSNLDIALQINSTGRRKLKIKLGVWAGRAEIGYGPQAVSYKSGIVIGPLDKRGLPKIEAHIINFKGNLYGKKLALNLNKYLRPFKKFKTEQELKQQIQKDILLIKQLTISS